MSIRRPWLLPLVPPYLAAVALKGRRFARHPERAQRLVNPVVSIGSLSAGGAGKTPFLIALGEALRRAGYGFDVLSRGYGRSSNETLRVRADGDAAQFGDEPLLLARRLACPVYVARQRFHAGTMAETDRRHTRDDRAFSLHLLDDGFQHRQLARTVDIVLFTAEDARDMLLPAGNRREPLRALRRADVIVVRDDEAEGLEPVLKRAFAAATMPPVWMIQRRFAFVDGEPPGRPLAFCGIARPSNFRGALAAAHVGVAEFMPLKDHQHYDDALIKKLTTHAVASHADGFVTTAKDAVKLTPSLWQTLSKTGPVAVADIVVQLREERQYIAQLIATIEAAWKRL